MNTINLIRTVVTVASFVIFLGLMAWAWSARRKSDFEQAALLPFADDASPTGARHV
jgi:cytochrome c oxidase cbb3-type subunit 4